MLCSLPELSTTLGGSPQFRTGNSGLLPIYRVILSDHLFLLHNVAPWSYELKTANNIATALITFLPEPIEYVWAWAKLAEI